MITDIEIKNFQAHRETGISLSDGLNVITGSSDAGKSSILRAILWVFLNRPLGEEFKSWFAKEKETVEVGVQFDDGYIIKERIKSTNKYKTSEIEDGFEAVKSDLPPEITAVTRLSEVNIQTQHQPYFLLNDTAGEVARKLNELSGLSVIDNAYRRANSQITLTKQDILTSQDRQAELKSELESLEYLDEIELTISEIEASVVQHEENQKKVLSLTKFIREIETVQSALKQSREILPAEKALKKLLTEIEGFETLQSIHTKLQTITDSITDFGERIETEKNWLQVESLSTPLCSQLLDFEMVKAKWDVLKKYTLNIETVMGMLEKSRDTLNLKHHEYFKLLEKIKICPICESEINQSVIKKLKEKVYNE